MWFYKSLSMHKACPVMAISDENAEVVDILLAHSAGSCFFLSPSTVSLGAVE